jgi:Tfp pilus assembly protein PilF
LKGLCGMVFDMKKLNEEEKEHVDIDLKVPILNNLGLCLIKLNKFNRSNQMLEKVLEIDKKNFKAWLRKA